MSRGEPHNQKIKENYSRLPSQFFLILFFFTFLCVVTFESRGLSFVWCFCGFAFWRSSARSIEYNTSVRYWGIEFKTKNICSFSYNAVVFDWNIIRIMSLHAISFARANFSWSFLTARSLGKFNCYKNESTWVNTIDCENPVSKGNALQS